MKDIFKNQQYMKIAKSDTFHQTAQHRYSFAWTMDMLNGHKKLLDIGCLFGSYLDFFNNDGMELHGLDIYNDIIEKDQRMFPDMNFHYGSVLEMPLPDNYFDIVTLWETIEHIPKGTESQAFREIRRVMKKDGLLLLSTPHNNWKANLCDTIQIKFANHRHYSKSAMVQLLESNGFDVRKVEFKGGYKEALYWLMHIGFKRTIRKHPMDTRVGRWLDKKVENEFKDGGFMEMWIAARAK